MHRFFVPSESISGKKIIVSEAKQAHHIQDVLRLKTQDELVIFDEKANDYVCVIEKLKPELTLFIKKMTPFPGGTKKILLDIACAIPRKSNMDDIVDKLTQLGVDKIIPLKTRRTIVKLDEKKKQQRLGHWQRVAQAASQQSQRSVLAVIEPLRDIQELLPDSQEYDLKLIPTLVGERKNIKEVLEGSHPKNILVLIGPEGDFTPEEISLAKKCGCVAVSLGRNVLRVETAAVAAASCIKLFYEDR